MVTEPIVKPLRMTREEYLAFEETAEGKHEFYRGEVFAMAGGTRSHSLLISNVLFGLRLALQGSDYIVLQGDMRVRVEAAGLYTYPDLSIICGEERYEDESQTTLLNPTVLVEVLSPSTERYDRGDKFRFYRQIPALQEYVLVAQERRSIEVFRKNADGHWVLFEPDEGGRVELASVGAVLDLETVYDGVETDDETLAGHASSADDEEPIPENV